MTKEEMIKLAIERLEKSACNEIELEGAVADSYSNFRVRVVKFTPVTYALTQFTPYTVQP